MHLPLSHQTHFVIQVSLQSAISRDNRFWLSTRVAHKDGEAYNSEGFHFIKWFDLWCVCIMDSLFFGFKAFTPQTAISVRVPVGYFDAAFWERIEEREYTCGFRFSISPFCYTLVRRRISPTRTISMMLENTAPQPPPPLLAAEQPSFISEKHFVNNLLHSH